MGKHRLTAVMPNGLQWWQVASGVVFVAANGDVDHVDRGTLGETGRKVDLGQPWASAAGEE